MTQHAFDFADITARKHKGEPTSVAANKRIAPVKANWREKVLTFIAEQGEATLMDACKYFNKERGQLSGRFSELRQLGVIKKVGERDGFNVYRRA
jgi:hypothetical protein